MVILQDSREQAPLEFCLDDVVTEQVVTCLPFGDYACEYANGWQPPLVFERKSIGDLWGTMTSGYARFKREMSRAKDAKTSLIIIVEGSLTEVRSGFERSQFTGDSMLRKLFTLRVRHGVETVFSESRQEMTLYIRSLYESIGRNVVAGKTKEECQREMLRM